jgi:hypothetical protein
MDDVDLILPPDMVDGAIATLTSVGWRVRQGPAGRTHEVDLVHPSLPGVPLDLHRELTTWRDRTNRLTGARLWEWRRPTTLYDAPAFTLPPEPELVALAAHAAKPFHTFDRLIWSVDAAMVIAAADDIDWAWVARLATEVECTTAVAVMLNHVVHLGLEPPLGLRCNVGTGTRLATLESLLSTEWPVRARAVGGHSLVRYALIDSWRARAVLAASDIIDEGPRAVPARARDLAARSLRQWFDARARRRSDQRGEHVGDVVEPRRAQR